TAASRSWSERERLLHKPFDRMSPDELRDAERLVDRVLPRLEMRRSRRQELHRHGRLLAARQMFRRNLQYGGDLVEWLWRRPVMQPRSVTVICDISGSMERHARLLIRFAMALQRVSAVRTEAFVFGTHLTRVTHELDRRDADAGLARVSDVVSDWSGGTRIGESLREFNRDWARRVLRSSGVVMIVSDGWDRGDPELVAREMARLQRSCHRLIWLDPLAGTEHYQPLAGGMAAAYPFIDDLVAVNDLASLQRLGDLLAEMADHRSRRPDRHGRPRVHRERSLAHAYLGARA
ncbi:MAG: VWA domain-containing protein, partial [Chloroflexota bacterium]